MVNLNIKCIFISKSKDQFILEGIEKYKKILKKYGQIEIKEIKSSKDEKEKILKSLRKDSYKIFLDLKGKELSTEECAKKFTNLLDSGINKFDFIVGGAEGFSKDTLNLADFIWKLSSLTFNHQLVRIILLEQLYRVFSIINGEKYHN